METQGRASTTSGPWEADTASDNGIRYHRIISPALDRNGWPFTVADTLNHHHEISEEEDRANALLLGAAMELAEALEFALSILGEHPRFSLVGEAPRIGEVALRKAGRIGGEA